LTIVNLSGNVPSRLGKRKLQTLLAMMFLENVLRVGVPKASLLLVAIYSSLERLRLGWALFLELFFLPCK
jgi:hypothetical protein